MTSNLPNFRALDFFRFFAAGLVAIGHANLDFRLGLESSGGFMARFPLFVDFFFVLSGFVIALSYTGRIHNARSYGDFLWRRLARLWPLHLLTLAGFALAGLAAARSGIALNSPDLLRLQDLPWNAALLHAWGPVWHFSYNGVSWSVSAEWFVYILFPLMMASAARLNLPGLLLLVVGVGALLSALRDMAGLGPWHAATYDLGALRAVPSFMLGVAIHKAVSMPALRFAASWPLAAASGFAALAAMQAGMAATGVIALFGLFIWLSALAELARGPGLLGGGASRLLGDASYGLYMLHVPVLTAMQILIRRSGGLEAHSPLVLTVVCFAVSLLAALIVHRLVERPARDWLNARSPFAPARAPGVAAA
jgi:peptidoglycan/LPS O-acetylase OafA/YrhL